MKEVARKECPLTLGKARHLVQLPVLKGTYSGAAAEGMVARLFVRDRQLWVITCDDPQSTVERKARCYAHQQAVRTLPCYPYCFLSRRVGVYFPSEKQAGKNNANAG